MNYKIHLDKFEGPLDLLLYLIKKNDIDIKDIPIAIITDQYMEYIEMMKLLDLDVVGDFLVMAATLMQIKSRMLLPPDPLAGPEVVDPRQELIDRLKEYEQFKLVADGLKSKELFRQSLYGRLVDEEKLNEIKEDAQEVLFEATLFDLINALSEALKHIPEKKDYQVSQEQYSIEGKIHDLLHGQIHVQRIIEKRLESISLVKRPCAIIKGVNFDCMHSNIAIDYGATPKRVHEQVLTQPEPPRI